MVVSNFWPKDKGSGMAFYQELFAAYIANFMEIIWCPCNSKGRTQIHGVWF